MLKQEVLNRLNHLEEILDRLNFLEEENQKLRAENAELRSRLAKYEKQDSSNSNQPPSIDRFKKNQSLREKSNKKSGGQIGHKGFTRLQSSNPDEIIDLNPERCLKCGEDLSSTKGKVASKRQEIDVTLPKPKTTEYRQIKKYCPICGKNNLGRYPDHINSPTQIGNNTKSLITYLHVAHKIPFKRTVEIISDLLGMELSQGTVENALEKAFEPAQIAQKEIMTKLKKSKYLHSDETGIRVDEKNWQLWVWCNKLYSYYIADNRRSYDVIKTNLGEDYQGIAIHDCHSAQNKTQAKKHQHCLVHYDRSLKYCIEEENCHWSQSISHYFNNARRVRDLIWQEGFDPVTRNRIIAGFHQALSKSNLMKNVPTKPEGWKLYRRILKHSDKLLVFMTNPELPSDNNEAERAIRNAKVHKKVSGCFRNPMAAKRYAAILSCIETAKKQGHKTLEACQSLLLGNFAVA